MLNLISKWTDACEDYLAAAIPNPGLFIDKPLTRRDFPEGALQDIFDASLSLSMARHPLSLRNIVAEISRNMIYQPTKMEGEVEDLFLNELMGKASSYKDGCYAWERVVELSKRRSIIQAAAAISRFAADESVNIVETLARIESALSKASEHADVDDIETVSATMKRLHTKLELAMAGHRDPSVMIGIHELDELTKGFREGEFIVVGGRPAMGKTALIMQWGIHAAKSGVGVCMLSMEMSKEGLDRRSVSSEVGLSRRDQFDPSESLADALPKVLALANEPWTRNFYVGERRGLTMAQIRATATRIVRRNPKMKLLILDYLQLAKGDSKIRHEEIAEISRFCKALAGELKITVLAAAQLSRALGSREDRRPQLTDLRESGQIEQDADMVIFVHREHYYDNTANPGVAELIVAKNRNDEAPTILVGFEGKQVRFTNDICPWDGPPGSHPFTEEAAPSVPTRTTLAQRLAAQKK